MTDTPDDPIPGTGPDGSPNQADPGPVTPGQGSAATPGAGPSPAGSGPEADPLAAGGDDENTRDAPLFTRRSTLIGGLALGGVALAGGGYAIGRLTAPTPQTISTGASNLLTNEVFAISHGGGICEAPLYAAVHQGLFEARGVRVELVKSAAGEDTKDGISTGKYVGGPGIFFSWLKPIEQGLDVKLTSGLHEGCLRLVTAQDSPLTTVAELRGKKIGVSQIGSSPMSFFSLDLLDAGIVPAPEAGQVQWLVFDNDVLPDALTRGEVDAIAASDPIALLPTLDGRAKELSNNRTGPNAQHYCCAVALNGTVIRDSPDIARALTLGWADGSRWVGANPDATARLEFDNKYVAGTLDQIGAVLKTYAFTPSAKGLRAEIEPGIAKFQGTGYLDKSTDPRALADKVYADLGFTW